VGARVGVGVAGIGKALVGVAVEIKGRLLHPVTASKIIPQTRKYHRVLFFMAIV